jgi:hypothetical protein
MILLQIVSFFWKKHRKRVSAKETAALQAG